MAVERLQNRRGTSNEWLAGDPNGADVVLASGELGLETDTNKFKIGNGSSTWQDLDYQSLSNLTASLPLSLNTDSGTRVRTISLLVGVGGVQAYDADLKAIADIADNESGVLRKTGSGTWAVDSATFLTTASDLAANKITGTISSARLPVVLIGTSEVDLTRSSGPLTLAGLTLTSPVINTLTASATDQNVSIYDDVVTGNISIGQGLTTGAFNIATEGSGAVPINIGRTGSVTTINGSLVIGDLTVNGTTTTVSSETVVVEDKNLELGSVETPTDATANGGGITLKGTTDKTITWDAVNSNWTSSENLNVALTKVYKIGATEVLSANTLGAGVSNSSLSKVAPLSGGVAGFVKVNSSGNLTADSATYLPTSTGFQTQLAANVTMTSAGTWYAGPAITFASAGTYLVMGTVTIRTAATAGTTTARIFNSSTSVAQASTQIYTTAVAQDLTLSLQAIVTVTAGQIVNMSATSTIANISMLAATNTLSQGNNASTLSAIRIA